jgi:protein tyrosine phosphatase (PTP) superfamily phosphohydrolase (DUF442 family)
MRQPVKNIALCSLLLSVPAAMLASLQDEPKAADKPIKVDVSPLHNVLRLNDKLYSGSGPEGDEAFHALQVLGIKTIISVDGAKPDLERAKTYGMRYVHIPIGYNGVPRGAALQLARAIREMPGPFYIHCHHGKHRGPSAAAIALLCGDDQCTVSRALGVLEAAGTDPKYKGLFQSVREFQRPNAAELAKVSSKLPEAVTVAGIVQAMVTIDHSWDNIRLVQAAGWKVPPDHPDIDPPHEALQLVEGFQELRRLPQIEKRPQDFRTWLADSHAAAKELESLLRTVKEQRPVNVAQADVTFKKIAASCTQCHSKYRDAP